MVAISVVPATGGERNDGDRRGVPAEHEQPFDEDPQAQNQRGCEA